MSKKVAVKITPEVLSALVHIAADIGEGQAVLNFKGPFYQKWANVKPEHREALRKFADSHDLTSLDWDELFVGGDKRKEVQ